MQDTSLALLKVHFWLNSLLTQIDYANAFDVARPSLATDLHSPANGKAPNQGYGLLVFIILAITEEKKNNDLNWINFVRLNQSDHIGGV